MSPITTERHGDVLVIISNNPPVNALSAAVRQGLIAGIQEATQDDAVKAVVIRCEGRTFFAGADITEFSKPPISPMLPEVVELIEACAKPVVAAIHGTALGGGLEVALGSHYRIAASTAKLGTPEVKLGLLPGAGGTQRLPRVAGIEAALQMCTSGTPISAADAAKVGLVDKVVDDADLVAAAIALAQEAIERGPRRSRDLPVKGDPAAIPAFREANARKFKNLDAPEYNIQAIEAATRLSFDDGMAEERRLFATLLFGTQSAALRHIFFAERQAGKIDGISEDVKPRDIRRVGVIGAGTMGGGISMNFLSAGIPVTIVETAQAALDRGTATIRKNYEATAAKGRMTADQVEAAIGLLTPTLDFTALAECDLVIEAVFEDMAVKKDVFTKLDKVAKPGAILATNTSFLNIDEIAAVTGRAQDILGLHFFSPANVMKLLEVVRAAKTAPDALATAMAVAKKIGKIAVIAGVCDGFIGNRILKPRQAEAMSLLLEGATPHQIDKVHVEFGMPMGPFQMADLAGVDIGWHRDPTRIENIRDTLCAIGRLGQKAGKGFYDYDDRRNPSPSAEVQSIIDDFAAKAGKEKRAISDQEIMERTIYPMVNEGAAILEEGMAQRASDIDIVWVYGYGWPAWRGGPMFWADLEGADKIVAGLESQKDRLDASFRLSPLLKEKAETKARFNVL